MLMPHITLQQAAMFSHVHWLVNDKHVKIKSIDFETEKIVITDNGFEKEIESLQYIKPVLRDLSSITDEEAVEVAKLARSDKMKDVFSVKRPKNGHIDINSKDRYNNCTITIYSDFDVRFSNKNDFEDGILESQTAIIAYFIKKGFNVFNW